MVPIFGKGIVYDAAPEIMKEQLAFLHPALKENRLKTYAAAFDQREEAGETFFDKWGDEGIVDLYDMATELTIYTSSRCLLTAKRFSCQYHLSSEFRELYQTMEHGITFVSLVSPLRADAGASPSRQGARAHG